MAKTSAAKAEELRSQEVAEQVKPKEKTPQEWLNERVPFQALYDGERYKDDIVVTINGKAWQIQRGKPVMIPRFVYMEIMDAERQKGVASVVSQGFEDKYKSLTKAQIL